MKEIKNNWNLIKRTSDEIIESLEVNVDPKKIKLFKSSIKKEITFYQSNDNKILICNFYLLKDRNIKNVLDVINKIDSNNIFILYVFYTKNKSAFISFKLPNSLKDRIQKGDTYISKEILSNHVDDCLNFSYIDWNSPNLAYEQMCKSIMYFDYEKSILQKSIHWDWFITKERIIKIEKKIKQLENAYKKNFNNQEKINITQSIKELKNEIEQEQFNFKQSFLDQNNEE